MPCNPSYGSPPASGEACRYAWEMVVWITTTRQRDSLRQKPVRCLYFSRHTEGLLIPYTKSSLRLKGYHETLCKIRE